jgi:hypothetical protein
MRIKLLLPAFGLVLGLLAGSASATTYVVSGNGLIAPNQNYGCPAGSPNCLTSKDFDLVGTALATGTITVNPTFARLSLEVASVQFSPTGGGSNVSFTYVSYAGTVNVFTAPGIVSQSGFATGTVSGYLDGTPFTAPAIVTNLTCTTTDSGGNCSVMFGPSGFSAGGQDWLHTFGVLVAVPEPALALLAFLGAAGLALRARD